MEAREIKFQVLHKNKIIGEERLKNNNWEWQHYELNPDNGIRWNTGVFSKEPNLIRRQFTGLRDKNGKEMYVGDVFISDYTGNIEWQIKFGEFKYTDAEGEKSHGVGFYYEKVGEPALCGVAGYPDSENGQAYEVIRHIYENPELLK